MNKLPIALLVGAMAMSTYTLAADQSSQPSQATPGDQARGDAPPQSNDAAGHPHERGPTGQAQTGARTTDDNIPTAKAPPQQSKDTVGHPEQRAPTGQAQTGQEPGQTTARETQ
jgi:hypothetical protein